MWMGERLLPNLIAQLGEYQSIGTCGVARVGSKMNTKRFESPWYVIRMQGGVGGEASRGVSLFRLAFKSSNGVPYEEIT